MTFDASMFFFLLFVSVVLISQALLLPAAGRKVKHKDLTKRLNDAKHNLDKESINLLNEHYSKSMTPLDRKLVAVPYFANLKKMIELAGIKTPLGTIILGTICICIITILVVILSGNPWYFGPILCVAILLGVILYINKKISDRLMKFEEQLPEALDIICRMLQTGQPLVQTFKEVGDELPAPLGEEFKNTFNLLNFGYDINVAILNMAERVPTVSLLAFSSAVLLQKDTGGNLAENLKKVSEVLRARFKLTRKIKTLSAESRMSAWILVLTPFALFALLATMNPEFVEPLYTDPRGHQMIGFGLISLMIGALWIRKIINIEV
ncbi:type II secretion system F family protein [Vibrio sp. SCSIO 43140]|uniref:type II secretion system F family protein n=1 Tax=Vibrio sp. SCSIO 43140 TaxID=2819100 RepID=UPI002074C0F7|nr:type II secretion system F family protein [Vibrio sp. SCSIO 43140]USD61779.1 type II secretion system F family protein [Vibrio sp. SCSIO 43140]